MKTIPYFLLQQAQVQVHIRDAQGPCLGSGRVVKLLRKAGEQSVCECSTVTCLKCPTRPHAHHLDCKKAVVIKSPIIDAVRMGREMGIAGLSSAPEQRAVPRCVGANSHTSPRTCATWSPVSRPCSCCFHYLEQFSLPSFSDISCSFSRRCILQDTPAPGYTPETTSELIPEYFS